MGALLLPSTSLSPLPTQASAAGAQLSAAFCAQLRTFVQRLGGMLARTEPAFLIAIQVSVCAVRADQHDNGQRERKNGASDRKHRTHQTRVMNFWIVTSSTVECQRNVLNIF